LVKRGYQEINILVQSRPERFLQPARYEGDGVTINKVADNGELILVSGFFDKNNGLRLIRRDGSLVAHWTLLYDEIFTDTSFMPVVPMSNWNVDTHGTLAMPDGSVVFNFDYSGMARIDRCGRVMWTVQAKTHHSVERAEGGGFWVPGNKLIDTDTDIFPPFKAPFFESTILRISDEGEILQEISVIKLFYNSGLETLLSSRAIYYIANLMSDDREIVHLNKIGELSASIAGDFPQFEAGDLVLSMRELNMVMVIDPRTEVIKWWKVGPWRRQHDPEFKAGGTIVVFNNNLYKEVVLANPITILPVSNIMEIDPQSGEHRVLWGGTPEQQMLSVLRGKVELTADGGLLITEPDGGRIFQTNAAGDIVWQYINRYDEDEVAELTEARIYPADYFDVSDWSCESTN